MFKRNKKATMSEEMANLDNIQPIYAHVKPDDRRWEKGGDIAWLMSPDGDEEAIKLQLDNLIATYGRDKIARILDKFYGGKS